MAEEAIVARAFVCVESGFYAGLEWPLDRPATVIGRGRQADLLLHEPTISRAHALLLYRADELLVQDLGSTNGTMINDRPEQQLALRSGDRIQMGRLQLRIRLARTSEAEEAERV